MEVKGDSTCYISQHTSPTMTLKGLTDYIITFNTISCNKNPTAKVSLNICMTIIHNTVLEKKIPNSKYPSFISGIVIQPSFVNLGKQKRSPTLGLKKTKDCDLNYLYNLYCTEWWRFCQLLNSYICFSLRCWNFIHRKHEHQNYTTIYKVNVRRQYLCQTWIVCHCTRYVTSPVMTLVSQKQPRFQEIVSKWMIGYEAQGGLRSFTR